MMYNNYNPYSGMYGMMGQQSLPYNQLQQNNNMGVKQ